mmetsp:Transcript_67074/g.216300  ORF Transcript_67074/g.216300 Transcript_67074/m.216300 type:complete len:210 (+) Transcript_67074:600-1229(+)
MGCTWQCHRSASASAEGPRGRRGRRRPAPAAAGRPLRAAPARSTSSVAGHCNHQVTARSPALACPRHPMGRAPTAALPRCCSASTADHPGPKPPQASPFPGWRHHPHLPARREGPVLRARRPRRAPLVSYRCRMTSLRMQPRRYQLRSLALQSWQRCCTHGAQVPMGRGGPGTASPAPAARRGTRRRGPSPAGPGPRTGRPPPATSSTA